MGRKKYRHIDLDIQLYVDIGGDRKIIPHNIQAVALECNENKIITQMIKKERNVEIKI